MSNQWLMDNAEWIIGQAQLVFDRHGYSEMANECADWRASREKASPPATERDTSDDRLAQAIAALTEIAAPDGGEFMAEQPDGKRILVVPYRAVAWRMDMADRVLDEIGDTT